MMPSSQSSTYLQIIQAVALPIIAILGAVIAYQQVRIARVKLNHDLYDRRFEIYEAAAALVKKISAEKEIGVEVTYKDLREYWANIAHAPFLSIGDDLIAFLHEIGTKANYHLDYDALKGNSVPLRETLKYPQPSPHFFPV